jgi:hypothetical protein
MSIFDKNNGGWGSNNNQNDQNNDNQPKSKDYLTAFAIVNDKSPFGRTYTKICKLLIKEGVPTTRLPTKEHFMSKIIDCIDDIKLNDWVSKYIDLEKAAIDDDQDADNDKQ